MRVVVYNSVVAGTFAVALLFTVMIFTVAIAQVIMTSFSSMALITTLNC